jgi:hypothetical protein
MAQPCDPLTTCQDLDGKLLLQRAVYGPQLAFDPGITTVGGVSTAGSALRAMLHLRFEVTWKATGLCQGPPTSVMGLAPGEVVTIGQRTRSTRTFSSLVRRAAEKSRTTSRSDRQTGPGRAPFGTGGLLGGLVGAAASAVGGGASMAGAAGGSLLGQSIGQLAQAQRNIQDAEQEAFDDAIELIPTYVGKFGSFFEDPLGAIGGVVTGAVSGAIGAVTGIAGAAGNAVADLVDNVIGGGGGPAGAGAGAGFAGTVQRISEIINTVDRSESESSLRESTVTTTTESEQTISRTFGNPYLDRSLQLRFIPVYQRFEVTTRIVGGLAGLATLLPRPGEAVTSPAVGTRGAMLSANAIRAAEPAFAAEAMATPRISAALSVSGDAGAESDLRSAMFSSVQKASQASGAARAVRLDQGLSWDRTTSVGNAVHVPLAATDIVTSAWGLRGKVSERVTDAIKRISPDSLARLAPASVKVVHVFAGLHVEAVPGSCVLPDIPEHLRVIVPGGTTYAAAPPASPTPDE